MKGRTYRPPSEMTPATRLRFTFWCGVLCGIFLNAGITGLIFLLAS